MTLLRNQLLDVMQTGILISSICLLLLCRVQGSAVPTYSELGRCPNRKSECQKVNDCSLKLFKDYCLVCDTCPKVQGETCGGPYFQNGVCATKETADVPKDYVCLQDNLKEVPLKETMNGVNITGVCRPKVCMKPVCKKTKRICGSDGVWRDSVCAFNKAKYCEPGIGDTGIYRIKTPKDQERICGSPTPSTTRPSATSSEQSHASLSIEATLTSPQPHQTVLPTLSNVRT